MGTDFSWMGRVVAHRSWGGRDVGVRVELTLAATSLPELDCTLKGDEGSRLTLRELARQVGAGACPEWNPCNRPGCLYCDGPVETACGSAEPCPHSRGCHGTAADAEHCAHFKSCSGA